jgi:uncharacterized protein (DUF2249 family)
MSESHALPVHPVRSGCGCSEHNHADPVLDARAIPHAIRHGAIFGALDSLGAGQALVLVAPHDPLPLLEQARQRYPGELSVDYVQSGPDAWHLRLGR